jgi:Spy/CpxP family protein refolding chaperone
MNEQNEKLNNELVIQKQSRRRSICFGLIILITGIVIGVSSAMLVNQQGRLQGPKGPGFASAAMIHRLQDKLQLTKEQKDKLKPIFDEHFEKLHEIRTEAQPKIVEQLNELNEEVAAVLTEKQLEKWEKNLSHIPGDFRPQMGGRRHGQGRPGEGGKGPGPGDGQRGPRRDGTGPGGPRPDGQEGKRPPRFKKPPQERSPQPNEPNENLI